MKNFTILVFLLFFNIGFAQQVKTLVLKEIYHKTMESTNKQPDFVRVDAKGGVVELSTKYNNGCTEKVHYEFNFDKDMSVLRDGETYGYTYFARIIDGNCETNPWREPYMKPGSSNGGWAALLGQTRYDRWVQQISGSGPYNYARARPGSKDVTGVQRGQFSAKGYTKGTHTFFYFDIYSYSHDPKETCTYEFLFVYELTDDVPSTPTTAGCVAPDCSSLPGTIPVWNFQNNRGECWCPEGMVWDRMGNRCVMR
ncbi:MAG: hypothetical protein KDC24_06175 [Saprospiraceae bacterium]|nr:hypothetical protein [Saprospiraceae bacterium]